MNRSIFIIPAALLIVGCQPIAEARYSSNRAIVNEAVKDPGSTVFRNEQVSSSGTYCAEVNSKNSYGGFVGFQRVMTIPDVSKGKSYVFFERDGLKDDGVVGALIQADIQIAALEARIEIKKRQIAGENLHTPSDSELREIALARVFKNEWAGKCFGIILEAPVAAPDLN